MGRGAVKRVRHESGDYGESNKDPKDNYDFVGPRVKSIRKTDDNLLKKTNKFEA
jgi:hypothetical protein